MVLAVAAMVVLILECVHVVHATTINDDIRKLYSENASLRAEIALLKHENEMGC